MKEYRIVKRYYRDIHQRVKFVFTVQEIKRDWKTLFILKDWFDVIEYGSLFDCTVSFGKKEDAIKWIRNISQPIHVDEPIYYSK